MYKKGMQVRTTEGVGIVDYVDEDRGIIWIRFDETGSGPSHSFDVNEVLPVDLSDEDQRDFDGD